MSEQVQEKKVSLREAMEVLTLGEAESIERHYGKSFPNELTSTNIAKAVIWATERRKFTGKDKPDWKDFDSWTFRDLNSYFTDEEVEVDEASPETDEGKGESPDA